YSMEGRSDPRDWFAAHGWTVSDSDPAAVLTDRGRSVPATALPELDRHILMTARRPRGDDDR
ncbi:SAM-dependent methyltransferase, partial [Nocardia gipuzkoensis]